MDRRRAERWFYSGLSLALLAAVLVGFGRTFYLKAWFPQAQALAAPEPFFLLHGTVFSAWFLLAAAQPLLVAGGRTRLHRTLGGWGAALALAMVVVGGIGAAIAGGRPGGFMGVPVPPLQFMVIPFAAIALFALFVTAAIAWRFDPQSHKRWMLLAGIAMVEAAVARWPFDFMRAAPPLPPFAVMELVTDAFLLPLVAWDLATRGRLHAVTLWGGGLLIVTQPWRLALGATEAWQAFARWVVALLG